MREPTIKDGEPVKTRIEGDLRCPSNSFFETDIESVNKHKRFVPFETLTRFDS